MFKISSENSKQLWKKQCLQDLVEIWGKKRMFFTPKKTYNMRDINEMCKAHNYISMFKISSKNSNRLWRKSVYKIWLKFGQKHMFFT